MQSRNRLFDDAAKLAGGAGLGPFAGAFETLGDAVNVEIVDVVSLGGDLRIEASMGNT